MVSEKKKVDNTEEDPSPSEELDGEDTSSTDIPSKLNKIIATVTDTVCSCLVL